MKSTSITTGPKKRYQGITRRNCGQKKRQELWIIKENKGIKWIGKQKFNTLSEEGSRWYEEVLRQHNEQGAAIHKDSIEEILIKKLLNQRVKRREKLKKYFKIYGHFLRQRINSDQKFARDIEEFKKYLQSKEYMYLRGYSSEWG